MLSEEDSKLYDSTSEYQQKLWHQSLDKTSGLPHRGDVYHVNFPQGLDDFSLVAFKTKHERDI